MQCPHCHHTESRVLESRSTDSEKSIRRRRECMDCKHRFTTYERIEFVPITVIKRDGHRELFDHSKLLRGIMRACEKTGMSHDRLEAIVEDLESQLQQRSRREATSAAIGDLVLSTLRHENEVAYVRFASVYRQFTGIQDFIDTLSHLQIHQAEQDAKRLKTPSPLTPH
ncbi:transcriptional regulator NrdR [Spirulina major CS-329]|uniref:transcriptional regulator NrdR n=1 Tax=Spirulina TaxID=1154 RepID=UPI0023303957|nr:MULTISPECIES: transcriptional regulator NrdR [Spirulina]MDB9496057.1 transcriptional regulator NrdR [Spirulina subsalsa CS-330]MDB9503738.1 transcriptional regulator NrdR [Spirulina major CS-329]